MEAVTLWTQPEPFIKRKRVENMSTLVASLRRWIELVNLDKRASIPVGFIFQLADELAPSHVGYRLGQRVIFDHVLDGKALEADHLVLANHACREFVLIIPSPISNTSVDTGNLQTRLSTILAALLFLGQSALRTGQLLLIFVEIFGVADMLPIRGDDHRLQAKIKPNLRLHHGKGLDIFFHQDGDEVAPCGILGDRDGGRLIPVLSNQV